MYDEGLRMSFDKRPSLNASAYTKQHNFKVTAKSACGMSIDGIFLFVI